MRTKKEIYKDYLILINKEKSLGYSDEEIKNKINDPSEQEIIKKLINDELYSTEEYKEQIVSILRAWFIWCNIIIKYDFKTGDHVWNEFVKEQFLLVEMHRFCCYMAARGHGKTFFFGLYVIFKMFLMQYFDTIYCSNVPKQKRRFLKLVRNLVDKNEFLLEKKDSQKVANKEIAWGTEEIEYNDGILEGTSVGTTPRGGHFNLAIGDDPLRDDMKYPHEFIINYFQGTLRPTIYRHKARYAVVGTPQDSEDLFHTLMNDKVDKYNRPLGKIAVNKTSATGFYSNIFPAILDETNKKVLNPGIWTYEELMAEKKKIGDIRFNREMMCRCISYRNALISASLFKSCCDENLMMLQKGEPGKKYVIFVDSATSDAPTADYCAMSVWEDDQAKNKFIFRHLFHEKGYPITDPTGGEDDQTHKLFNLFKDFNKALLIVEKNNAGIALSQAVQAIGEKDKSPVTVPVIEHFTHVVATGKPTDKPGKANDVIDYIEHGIKAGVIIFPSHPNDIYTIDTLEQIKTEHLNFGVKKGKSGEKYEAIAGKDDIFDTCWGAFKHRGDMVDTIPAAITLP